jgi:hypothetical protein
VTQHDGRNLSGAVARIVAQRRSGSVGLGLSSERGRQRAAPIYTRANHHMLFCSPQGARPRSNAPPPLRIGATFSGSIGAVPWVHRRASQGRRPSPQVRAWPRVTGRLWPPSRSYLLCCTGSARFWAAEETPALVQLSDIEQTEDVTNVAEFPGPISRAQICDQ